MSEEKGSWKLVTRELLLALVLTLFGVVLNKLYDQIHELETGFRELSVQITKSTSEVEHSLAMAKMAQDNFNTMLKEKLDAVEQNQATKHR